MTATPLSTEDLWKAIAVGIVTAVLLIAIMLPAFKFGLSPMPEIPSLAFVEAVLGRPLPLAVGVQCHAAYVTFWSVVYVALFRDRLTFLNAFYLALALWATMLVVVFPVIGWGFLGLGISVKLIPTGLLLNLLFALFVWSLCRLAFRAKPLRAARE
jgi:hypothetical protein